MGLYEGIKDVAKVIQQADNVELYKQLIDLSAQALDMQNEISRLSDENTKLKKSKDIENNIERHSEPYITLKNDSNQILFCSHCWDYEQKLIQVKCYSGKFNCTHCENNGIYDRQKYETSIQNAKDAALRGSQNNRRNYW